MRFIIAAAPISLLAACGAAERQPDAAADPAGLATMAEPQGAAPAEAGASAPSPAPDPSPTPAAAAERAFEWTGRFAASPELCTGGAWQIGRTRVDTAGETACTVKNLVESGTGATLELSCLAEGMASEERWTLAPAGQGRMRVSRASVGGETVEVDLVRCG